MADSHSESEAGEREGKDENVGEGSRAELLLPEQSTDFDHAGGGHGSEDQTRVIAQISIHVCTEYPDCHGMHGFQIPTQALSSAHRRVPLLVCPPSGPRTFLRLFVFSRPGAQAVLWDTTKQSLIPAEPGPHYSRSPGTSITAFCIMRLGPRQNMRYCVLSTRKTTVPSPIPTVPAKVWPASCVRLLWEA